MRAMEVSFAAELRLPCLLQSSYSKQLERKFADRVCCSFLHKGEQQRVGEGGLLLSPCIQDCHCSKKLRRQEQLIVQRLPN